MFCEVLCVGPYECVCSVRCCEWFRRIVFVLCGVVVWA